jgi:hypothetical protein
MTAQRRELPLRTGGVSEYPEAEASPTGLPQWITMTDGPDGPTGRGHRIDDRSLAVNAEFADGWLSAGQVRIEPVAAGSEQEPGIQLAQGPINGTLRQEAGDLTIAPRLPRVRWMTTESGNVASGGRGNDRTGRFAPPQHQGRTWRKACSLPKA